MSDPITAAQLVAACFTGLIYGFGVLAILMVAKWWIDRYIDAAIAKEIKSLEEDEGRVRK